MKFEMQILHFYNGAEMWGFQFLKAFIILFKTISKTQLDQGQHATHCT